MSPGRGTLPDGLQHRRHCQRVAAGGRLSGSAGMSGTGDRWSVSLREPRAPWPCPLAACGDLGQLSGRRAGGRGDKPRGQPRAAILVQPWPWMCPCGSAPVLSIAAQKTCPQGLLRGGGTAHGPHGTGHGPSTMEHQDPLCDLSLPQTGCHPQGSSSLGVDEGSWEQARCLESTARAPAHHFTSGNSGFFQRQLLPPQQSCSGRELPPGTGSREMAPDQPPFCSPAQGTVGDWKVVLFHHYIWRHGDPRIEFMHKIGLLSQGI